MELKLAEFILKIIYADFCGRCGGLFSRSCLHTEKKDIGLGFEKSARYCTPCFDIRGKFEKQFADRLNCENCNRIREEEGRQKLSVSYEAEIKKSPENQDKIILDRYMDKEFRIFMGKSWCSIHT